MTRRVLATLLLAAYASGSSAQIVLAQDYTFQRPSSSTPAPIQAPSQSPMANPSPAPTLSPSSSTPAPIQTPSQSAIVNPAPYSTPNPAPPLSPSSSTPAPIQTPNQSTMATPAPLGPAPYSKPNPLPSQAISPAPSSASPQVLPPPPNLNIPTTQQPQKAPLQQPLSRPQTPVAAAEAGYLPIGSTLPLAVPAETNFNPQQTLPVTLEVTENVVDQDGRVVVPRGSKVDGNFVPVFRTVESRERSSYRVNQQSVIVGNRFEAKTLIIGNQSYSLLGKTLYVPTSKDPKVVGEDPALKGAAYGFAGGVALTIVTGGLALPVVLMGTGAGAAAGYAKEQKPVVKLAPGQPLTMTLESALKTY